MITSNHLSSKKVFLTLWNIGTREKKAVPGEETGNGLGYKENRRSGGL